MDDAIYEMQSSSSSSRGAFPSSDSSSSAPGRRWTCKLCSQTKNTADMEVCKTCRRPRGHNPEKYQKRLEELRQWTCPQDYAPYEEDTSWPWGLIIGLIILFCVIALLAWAAYEDQKEFMMDNLEL
mmetsp:Transcript_81190/g.225992  ORF Transcript_81190/g.225992 Transcript_81190/m.225992 type:complete len:126 (-) Transcript_81190:235-612(-)